MIRNKYEYIKCYDTLTNQQLIDLRNLYVKHSMIYNNDYSGNLFMCLDQKKAQFPYPTFTMNNGKLQGSKASSDNINYSLIVSYNIFKLVLLKWIQITKKHPTMDNNQSQIMDKNEIKKLLYKQNPIATFNYIRKGTAYYETVVNAEFDISHKINFEVPVSDMGDADFKNEMESKLLNRWIVINE